MSVLEAISTIKQRLSVRTNVNLVRNLIPVLGVRSATQYVIQSKIRHGGTDVFQLRPPAAKYPVSVRRGTSDIRVFRQIFIQREYSTIDTLTDVKLVVDCGANVGYSSVYFLSRFPQCEVVAVEPDAGNFEMLEANVRAYGQRIRTVRAGIWSHRADLVISERTKGEGDEWGRQVRERGPNEASDAKGMDIPSILALSGHQRISILKVDIEGTEGIVFSQNAKPWLDKTDTIVIELHDALTSGKASEAFFDSIRDQRFEISRSGELTICRRIER